jgi:hypothetical protein
MLCVLFAALLLLELRLFRRLDRLRLNRCVGCGVK